MNKPPSHKPPVATTDSGAKPDNLRSAHRKQILDFTKYLMAVNVNFNNRYPGTRDGSTLMNPDHIFGNLAQIQYYSEPTVTSSVEGAIDNIEDQKATFDKDKKKVIAMLQQPRYSKMKSAAKGVGSDLSPHDWLKQELEKVDTEYKALMKVLEA